MSVIVSSWVWEFSRHKGSTLLLMLYLANCAHDDGTNIFPSVKTMAKRLRMSEREVRYLLRKLEASGEVSAHPNAGPNGTTLYEIPMGQSLPPAKSVHEGGQPIAAKPSEEPSKATKGACKISPDFIMSEHMRAYAQQHGLRPEATFEKFKLYHESKGDRKIDWSKAFMLWCRNEVDWNPKHLSVVTSPVPPARRVQYPEPPDVTPEQARENIARIKDMMAKIGRAQ